MKALSAVAVLALLLVVPAAHANLTTGSLGFATPLLTTADASPTGDINTSNIFTLQSLVSTGNEAGVFMGLPLQNFGTVSFDTTLGASLHISDTEFGSFRSLGITVISNTPGFLNILLQGLWTPGTFNSHFVGPFPANFRMSFTQSPATIGEISFSGTMGTAFTQVPEPATWLLCLTGLVFVLVGTGLRRLWA